MYRERERVKRRIRDGGKGIYLVNTAVAHMPCDPSSPPFLLLLSPFSTFNNNNNFLLSKLYN